MRNSTRRPRCRGVPTVTTRHNLASQPRLLILLAVPTVTTIPPSHARVMMTGRYGHHTSVPMQIGCDGWDGWDAIDPKRVFPSQPQYVGWDRL